MVELSEILFNPIAIDEGSLGGVVSSRDGMAFVIVDLKGSVKRKFELADDFRFVVGLDQSNLWLAHDNQLGQCTLAGEPISDLELRFESGARRIGAAILAKDGFLVATERQVADPEYGWSGELIRMTKSGEVIWGSILPVKRIEFSGCVEANLKNGFQNLPKPPWKPKQWVTDSRAPIMLSGDYVFASWQEFPRSGIGKYYVSRFADGVPLKATHPFPVSWSYDLIGGRILISANGYGVCQTMSLESNPDRLGNSRELNWPTHGRYYQTSDGEIYCVEVLHGKRQAYVVRLLEDGTTARIGEPLPGYYTSQPMDCGEGRFCFWRAGQIWVCDPKSNSLETLVSNAGGEQDYAESVRLPSNQIVYLVYRNPKSAAKSKCSMHVLPCGETNGEK